MYTYENLALSLIIERRRDCLLLLASAIIERV